MNHTGSSSNCIGGRPGRRAHDQAITLDARHMLAVNEKVDIRKVRRRSSIHYNLIQYQKIRRWFGQLTVLILAYNNASQTTP